MSKRGRRRFQADWPPSTELQEIAEAKLRRAQEDARDDGTPPRYILSGRFHWSELAADVTQVAGCLDMSTEEFRERMSSQVLALADQLVAAWAPKWRALKDENARRLREHERQARELADMARGDAERAWEQTGRTVSDKLQDALGELYGRGDRASFILANGSIDWKVLGEICGVAPLQAALAASETSAHILREIRDYVLSRRDPVERWLSESRLGLPTDPPWTEQPARRKP